MSGFQTQHTEAMRVADWRAEAALTGKTFAQVACENMRARMSRPKTPAGIAWGEISQSTRVDLLTYCTSRTGKLERIGWEELTPEEQVAVGVQARTWARDLHAMAGLLR